MRIHDISPPIEPELAVWPGDTVPSREVLLDIDRGDNITLSTLRTTVHAGAHVDAPSHYGAGAPTIEACELDRYVGPCIVLRPAVGPGECLGADALPSGPLPERVLFATGTYADPRRFDERFAALSTELIDALAARGVRLVGVDTPSVDRFTSRALPCHAACLRHDVAILEGLVLRDVAPGDYELIALPLRLVGFDASPVRAILRELKRSWR